MSNKITFSVDDTSLQIKLGSYLKNTAKLSSRLIRQAAREHRIEVNNKVENLSYKLSLGDIISVELERDESQNIEPEKMDIDVIYEDSDILVVNKSSGMVVHPTRRYTSGTLANGVLYYFKEKNENCIVRLVNRLDMDTSGLIIIAKNQFSHMALARDFEKDGFEKSYIAVVHGNLEENQGTIDLPIYRPGDGSINRIVDDRGQRSITHFKVIERIGSNDIVKLTLETGRTHQIRVHLSYIGHPIFGDSLYGNSEDEYIKRQALHAYSIKINQPRTGEPLVFETELPDDMKLLIEKLRSNFFN